MKTIRYLEQDCAKQVHEFHYWLYLSKTALPRLVKFFDESSSLYGQLLNIQSRNKDFISLKVSFT